MVKNTFSGEGRKSGGKIPRTSVSMCQKRIKPRIELRERTIFS
jgi:hypothetical protein